MHRKSCLIPIFIMKVYYTNQLKVIAQQLLPIEFTKVLNLLSTQNIYEQQHEISNNVVFATSKDSDQPAHMHSLIRAVAGRLNIL